MCLVKETRGKLCIVKEMMIIMVEIRIVKERGVGVVGWDDSNFFGPPSGRPKSSHVPGRHYGPRPKTSGQAGACMLPFFFFRKMHAWN